MRSIVSSLLAIMLIMGCKAENTTTDSKETKKAETKTEVVKKETKEAPKKEEKKETPQKEVADLKGLGDGLFANMKTNMGTIVIKLEFEKTPLTVASFVGLAEGTKVNTAKKPGEPYFNGIIFHRVIKGFVIQGGDPLGAGHGGPGYRFPDEFDPSLKHSGPGVLSMANAGPGTNGSQFFITHNATPNLDNRHAVFGTVVKGLDVVDAIANVQTARGDRPVTKVVMQEVTIHRVGEKAKAFKGDEEHFQQIFTTKFPEAAKAEAARQKRMKEAEEAAKVKYKEMEASIKVKFPKAQKSAFGNYYAVTHKKGSGATPEKGTKVSVHYAGSLLENGKEFDSSIKRNRPFSFNVGTGRVIRGWDLAVANMKKGEKQTIILPPELGYGPRGAGGVIPPNAWLVFEVELLDF